MKKSIITVMSLGLLIFFGCTFENLEEETLSQDPNFRVTEAFRKTKKGISSMSRASLEEPCMTTNLIAGQHHIAGTITVDTDAEDLIITYTTNEDWTIKATHMSIGNCEDQSIPTTGSGNPKVGKFEHHTTHSDGVNEVIYRINKQALNNEYCFAAHAEVTGPTGGETAWAEGTPFDGNSWAMFVEALLSDCDVDGDSGER